MFAAHYNTDERVVQVLLGAGADVNEKDKVSELLNDCLMFCHLIVCGCRMGGQL